MSIFKNMWAIIVTSVMTWFSMIDNNVLNKVVSLLTILIFLIGLTDWTIRKIKGRANEKKQENKKQDRRQVLDLMENTQKPFRTVNMLDNPMETSEKIENLLYKVFKKIGGITKMKKFFKWIWYNKEQLISIIFLAVIIALANIMLFTNAFDTISSIYLGATMPLGVKITAVILGIALTALTVRNVCVKYGLSSLDTIKTVLAERAFAVANKLPPEQKKTLKSYIATLEDTLQKAKNERATAEKELAEIDALFNADNTLVSDYSRKKSELTETIAYKTEIIKNVESKITDYKAQLSGKNSNPSNTNKV